MKDPVFWLMLAVLVFAALRWINSGLSMVYDSEAGAWAISTPMMPLMPSAAKGYGYLEFASVLAMALALFGCRSVLNRSARYAFLLVAPTLSGIAALIMVNMLFKGNRWALALVSCPLEHAAYIGIAFGVYLLAGIVALVVAFEKEWRHVVLLAFFSVGGNALGLFLFAPVVTSALFGSAAVLIFIYSFFYAFMRGHNNSSYKVLVVFGLSIACAVVLAMMVTPESVFSQRINAFDTGVFFSENFMEMRSAISAVAMKAWQTNPWMGSGVGTFNLDLAFNATEEDWFVILSEQATALNGYWQILCERGLIGATVLAAVFGFILVSFIRRLVKAFGHLPHPSCFVGLLAAIAALVDGLVSNSFMIPGVLVAIVVTLAISANSFPKEKKHNGR